MHHRQLVSSASWVMFALAYTTVYAVYRPGFDAQVKDYADADQEAGTPAEGRGAKMTTSRR